jgi:hypothetical protein
MANRLPADLLDDDADLPEFFVHANCGYELEWYNVSHDQRGLVVYRYTASGRFSWSVSVQVRAGETHASVVRRATENHREAA